MQPILTELLNLPGIEVENYTKVADRLILEVEAKTTKAKCPRCGEESNHLHQNRWYFARDLSISGQEVLLKVNRRQWHWFRTVSETRCCNIRSIGLIIKDKLSLRVNVK